MYPHQRTRSFQRYYLATVSGATVAVASLQQRILCTSPIAGALTRVPKLFQMLVLLMTFQVFTAASMKTTVLRDVEQCNLPETDRRFRNGYCLHSQGDYLSRSNVYYLKRNLTTLAYYGTKIKSETGPTLESRSPWLLGRCSNRLRKSCAGAKMVCSRAERVFILKHYFDSKQFSAARKAFSNVYLDREVPNKTTMHRLITKCWVTACAHLATEQQ
jgi:hypothetical protein